jgi:hypothetical protein
LLDAVAEGRFHVWPVAKVGQGIEILTEVTAGNRNSEGKFEAGTVFSLVDGRLREMAETLKEFE